jgi:hypothetical protein
VKLGRKALIYSNLNIRLFQRWRLAGRPSALCQAKAGESAVYN